MEITDLELSNVPGGRGGPITLLCITTSSGLQGWGEGRFGWRDAELADRARTLLPALAGRSVFSVAELTTTEFAHDPALACAVELALWDLIAQSAGQPLCNLWGGAYRAHVPLAVRIDAGKFLANEQLARELIEHGFHHLMLAATGDVDRDAAAVRRLHQLCGASCAISLDGRSLYRADEILRLCGLLGEGAFTSILDPVEGDDLAVVCSLARLVGVPLALSRGIRDERQVLAVVRDGGPRCIFVDPRRVGGLLAATRAISVAAAGGLTVALNMTGSAGIAIAGMLHLAATMPQLNRPNLCDYPIYHRLPIIPQLSLSDGAASVPQEPGLGVAAARRSP